MQNMHYIHITCAFIYTVYIQIYSIYIYTHIQATTYIYIYEYICMCTYAHTSRYIYVSTLVYALSGMHPCIYVCMCTHIESYGLYDSMKQKNTKRVNNWSAVSRWTVTPGDVTQACCMPPPG